MFFNWRNMKFKSAWSSISFSPSLLFALASLHSSQRSYSHTFSAFLRIIGGRQLYGSNLTPLFSPSTPVALWESITCRASYWARGWLLSHTLVCSPMKNGDLGWKVCDSLMDFFFFFNEKAPRRLLSDWRLLNLLVSDGVSSYPIWWPQLQTHVHSYFQTSFHLLHTHTQPQTELRLFELYSCKP